MVVLGAFFLFSLYVRIKCLLTYSDIELQLSDSVYHLAQSPLYFSVSGRRAPLHISCKTYLDNELPQFLFVGEHFYFSFISEG